jgi:glycine cleavage system H protein
MTVIQHGGIMAGDMNFPQELRYTKTHEWARKHANKVTVGISDYAQKEISDVVFVELPKIGNTVEQAKPVAVVESVKAAFDIYTPVSGRILHVNKELEINPALVNREPYGQGWFFEIEMSDPGQWDALLTAEQYEKMLKQETK